MENKQMLWLGKNQSSDFVDAQIADTTKVIQYIFLIVIPKSFRITRLPDGQANTEELMEFTG